MANEELPTDYDAIILGTGMTECLVAAALSRIGYKVLHLDRNDYYSGDWACFHFESLRKWIAEQQGKTRETVLKVDADVEAESVLKESESLLPLQLQSSSVSNVVDICYVRNEPVESVSSGTPSPQVPSNQVPPSEQPGGESADVPTCEQPVGKDVEMLPGGDPTEVPPSEQPAGESADMPPNEQPGGESAEVPPGEKAEQPSKGCDGTDLQEGVHGGEIDSKPGEPAKKEWTYQELQSMWRKFNIDLVPKILYCRGPTVELLISSDVAKYCEFRTITRVLTHISGQLQQVPCSRADVFSSKQVSMIEKRMLMKLLTFCMEFDKHQEEYKGFEEKPFAEFLESKKLSRNVRHYVQHAIAMATDGTSTIEGLKSTQKFLQSLGRYGNTAFLWPLYGSGELPQSFCRMCAVFGGVYCLRRTAIACVLDADNKCCGIVDTTGQRLSGKWLVMETSYATPQLLSVPIDNKKISRAILIADRSLSQDTQLHMSLLHLPISEDQPHPITVLELSGLSMTCPDNLYMIHLTCVTTQDASADLQPTVTRLFHTAAESERTPDDTRPSVLWSVYFNIADTTETQLTGAPDNVFMVSGPSDDLDFDRAIIQAREVFEKICPGEEFLPRAPNPEDIIYDDGEGNQPKESGFEPTDESDKIKGSDSATQDNDTEGGEPSAVTDVTVEGSQNTSCEPPVEGNQAVEKVTGEGKQASCEGQGEGNQAAGDITGEGNQDSCEGPVEGSEAAGGVTREGNQASCQGQGEGTQAPADAAEE